HKAILPAAVAEEKRRVINAARGVEWTDPDPRGLDSIGGLDLLKTWLLSRKEGFSSEARAFGLPSPKGVLLVGVSGTGKSLTAKAAATAFECPLLRLDLGAAQSKWVGESQANIRGALSVAETVGRCVLWIDEIEKALAGAIGGTNDGGVSADALGTLLSWMQDRKGQVFVIATANDVSKLPPELLRKQRWDDLFFVDLPTTKERREIMHVAALHYGRVLGSSELDAVASATERFSGAEIDALMSPALYAAFADGRRELRVADLLVAAKETVPLADTARAKIEELRSWAHGRARRASSLEEVLAPVSDGNRVVDIDQN
ncbi:MAG TPA: AAA family ATPase, partial [Vicinamibacterales bacterium]|nr:AAA family ATPase [Vicinamibacterales bacterium]